MPGREVCAARVRAAWRARACCCAAAIGAQVFAVGASAALPLCLNSAWLAMLAAAALAPGAVYLARRGRMGRVRRALCAAALTAGGALCALCAAALAQRALLSQARGMAVHALVLAFVLGCVLCGGTGVERLLFALRFALPLLLLALSARALPRMSLQGIYPLLGAGGGETLLAAAFAPAALTPALILCLPPPHVRPEQLMNHPAPPARFFAWRAVLGAVCGAALCAALSLCNGYELLAEQRTWGERLRIVSSGKPGVTILSMGLTLAQLSALALAAGAQLCAAMQALSDCRALRWTPCAVLALIMGASAVFGHDALQAAVPFAALPLLGALAGGWKKEARDGKDR